MHEFALRINKRKEKLSFVDMYQIYAEQGGLHWGDTQGKLLYLSVYLVILANVWKISSYFLKIHLVEVAKFWKLGSCILKN